jgi:hypothetical protein
VTAGDPLAGLPRPVGEPALASGAGRKYTAAATQLDTAATQVLKAVHNLGSDWVSAGSSSAGRCSVALAAVYSQAAQAAHSGGAALTRFGTALGQAQAVWDRAHVMAGQAMADESSYRSTAETQAQHLDKQAAAGNIGAAHSAASVREDAASYTSPLRSRAMTMATQARQDAQTAAGTAAGQLGAATSAMAALPPAPSPVSGGKGGGGDSENVFQWFNDMVLGATNTGAALLTLPPAVLGAAKWGAAARSAARLPADLRALWDSQINSLALLADRGDLPWSAVESRVGNYLGARSLYQGMADTGVTKGKLSFLRGGLPDTPVFETAGRVLGGVAIVGDVGTLIDPGGNSVGEDTANRTAAGLNAVSTLVVLNAAGDEVPVAGEVIMVGTGLYLGGDWLYNHWSPFHDAMDDAGHGISTAYHATTHALGTAMHDANPLNW